MRAACQRGGDLWVRCVGFSFWRVFDRFLKPTLTVGIHPSSVRVPKRRDIHERDRDYANEAAHDALDGQNKMVRSRVSPDPTRHSSLREARILASSCELWWVAAHEVSSGSSFRNSGSREAARHERYWWLMTLYR